MGQQPPNRRQFAAANATFLLLICVAPLWPVCASAAMFTLPVGTERQRMPLDCEATSLTIALRAVGVQTSQNAVQSRVPVDLRAPVLGPDGLPSQWGDAYSAFVGHVSGSEPGSNPNWAGYPGWGMYAPVVAAAAASLGVPVTAKSGWAPSDIYNAVLAGHPVLVWTTVSYSTQTPRTWTAWDGRSIPWTLHGHVVVLMGVDTASARLQFSDPLSGTYNGTSMAQFERTFAYYGNMALVVQLTAHPAPPPPVVHTVVVPPPPRPAPTPNATAPPSQTPTAEPKERADLIMNKDATVPPIVTTAVHPPTTSPLLSPWSPAKLGLAAGAGLLFFGTGARLVIRRLRSGQRPNAIDALEVGSPERVSPRLPRTHQSRGAPAASAQSPGCSTRWRTTRRSHREG